MHNFKNFIKNIIVDDIDVSFIYESKNCLDAALLRKTLMTKIECYTINHVTFNEIPDRYTPEKLSGKFGLLIPHQVDVIGYLDVKGPKMVKCSDVTNMTFVYDMPLIYLDDNESLKCSFVLKKDIGETHGKWNPVASIKFKEHEEGFIFTFELTGLLTMDEIMKQL
jgi:hypothetical protein